MADLICESIPTPSGRPECGDCSFNLRRAPSAFDLLFKLICEATEANFSNNFAFCLPDSQLLVHGSGVEPSDIGEPLAKTRCGIAFVARINPVTSDSEGC